MSSSTGSGELSENELKEILSLEFITHFDRRSENNRDLIRKIGFSKGKFVIMEVEGSRCKHEEILIHDNFYETLRNQAQNGEYRTAKEFTKGLVESRESINY